MKNTFKTILLLVSAAVLVTACDGQGDSLINARLDENPLPDPVSGSSGDADFSKYVSIGNSLTAGYMDGALYTLGQSNSIPALLAGQFAYTVDGDYTFNQPDINSVNGFNTTVTNPALSTVFGRYKLDTSIPGPSPTINGDIPAPYSGPALNNFGVPGIQVGQLLTAATGGPDNPANPAYNGLYARFASDPGNSTILGDAIAAQPTFFTLWIGNNDVLGYAVSGASNSAILTSDADFNTYFGSTVSSLMTNTSADGVVIDIPFFLGLAYFQAVRWNNITLDANTAAAINSGMESINGAIQGCANVGVAQSDIDQRLVSYSEGNNPILVIDEELDDLGTCFDALLAANAIDGTARAQLVPYEQSRPLTQGELVLLSAGAVLGTEADGDATTADTPIGVVVPLGFNMSDASLNGDRYYLSLAEQQEIENKRITFNTIIAGAVSANSDRLALYNTSPFGGPTNPCTSGIFCDLFGLSDGVPGITYQGVSLEPDFSPNGVLSTDGIHPNPRGNAIIANEIIKVIEDKWGSDIPMVNLINLPSVTLCGTGDCLSEQ